MRKSALLLLLALACVRPVPTWLARGPTWPGRRAPFVVRVDVPGLEAPCRTAAELWNEQLGFRAWVLDEDAAAPDVVVDSRNGAREGVTDFGPGRPVHVGIRALEAWREAPLCAHELGHALGLADDPEDLAEVMNPQGMGPGLLRDPPGSAFRLPATRAAEADLEAVRAAYGPRKSGR